MELLLKPDLASAAFATAWQASMHGKKTYEVCGGNLGIPWTGCKAGEGASKLSAFAGWIDFWPERRKGTCIARRTACYYSFFY